MVRPGFVVRGVALVLLASGSSGCTHFWDDMKALNERGEWFDFGYKMDLAWNQGGPPLKVLAESQDGDLRRRAIMRLTEPGDEKEREHYILILSTAARSERDTVCRLAAVQQLATYKDPKATQALADAYAVPANATEMGGMVQIAAVDMLGKRKDPAALDTLVIALDPKNRDDLRAAAAQALGKYPNYKAAEALLASLKQERNTAVRHEVHTSLVKLTGRDLPPDAAAWDQAFQQAATRGEPLAKEPSTFIKLASWWSE
jgi:HEAT repeat protein